MELITNFQRPTNATVLADLIASSKRSTLCSGWIKRKGAALLVPSITKAIRNGASITIYTEQRTTPESELVDLRAIPGVGIFVACTKVALHTKLYYFESESNFSAVIGSANITLGGLQSNDELCVHLNGSLADPLGQQLRAYLAHLSAAVGSGPTRQSA
ncbi:restriction endonuclease PLD domain-containing protein [Variovorax sp. YR216]|uniref:restriction endonuclease PLD domain-containing protein n=1 Tax=Variovorax sp. YR216 TaxID=1882828 RepID=UPI000B80B6B4|nr:phospholipase D family protein [Variovorax sp. YR216]